MPDRTKRQLAQRSTGVAARQRAHLAGIAERHALAQSRDPQRIIGPAHAGTADRLDANNACALLDRAGIDALHFGFEPPRFALGKKISDAATREREHAEMNKSDENKASQLHDVQNASKLINYSSSTGGRWADAVAPWSTPRNMVKNAKRPASGMAIRSAVQLDAFPGCRIPPTDDHNDQGRSGNAFASINHMNWHGIFREVQWHRLIAPVSANQNPNSRKHRSPAIKTPQNIRLAL